MHAVLTGAAQLGVTSLPLEHRGLTVHWIGQAACVVALPDNDPLAAHEVVPVSALAGRRLITMANPYRLRRRLDAALAANAPAAGTIETNSSINALAAVRAGLGVSVLEPVTAYGTPMPGVAIRSIDLTYPFLRRHHAAGPTALVRLPDRRRHAGRGRRRAAARFRPA